MLDTMSSATNKIGQKNYTFFDLEKYRLLNSRTDITRQTIGRAA